MSSEDDSGLNVGVTRRKVGCSTLFNPYNDLRWNTTDWIVAARDVYGDLRGVYTEESERCVVATRRAEPVECATPFRFQRLEIRKNERETELTSFGDITHNELR